MFKRTGVDSSFEAAETESSEALITGDEWFSIRIGCHGVIFLSFQGFHSLA
jgi:hypothetical protein